MTFKEIAKIILSGKKIAIIGHENPDCDAFGSAFSLEEALTTQFNKQVDVFLDGKIEEKEIFSDKKINTKEFRYKNYDLIVIVDTRSPERLGKFCSAKEHDNVLRIDHHEGSDGFFKHEYVEKESSSTSELIYLVLKEMKAEITSKIATFLYSGISTDTNSFINDNVTARAMRISAELLEKGANFILVNKVCYKSTSKERWKLNKVVYDKAEIFDNFAIVCITARDLKKTKATASQTSSYANQLVSIDGVKIGCSITHKSIRSWRCSFRSLLGTNVNGIATKLGGGGHKQAAACTLSGNERKVKELVISAIKEELNKSGR